jgi:hypothetical protein
MDAFHFTRLLEEQFIRKQPRERNHEAAFHPKAKLKPPLFRCICAHPTQEIDSPSPDYARPQTAKNPTKQRFTPVKTSPEGNEPTQSNDPEKWGKVRTRPPNHLPRPKLLAAQPTFQQAGTRSTKRGQSRAQQKLTSPEEQIGRVPSPSTTRSPPPRPARRDLGRNRWARGQAPPRRPYPLPAGGAGEGKREGNEKTTPKPRRGGRCKQEVGSPRLCARGTQY